MLAVLVVNLLFFILGHETVKGHADGLAATASTLGLLHMLLSKKKVFIYLFILF